MTGKSTDTRAVATTAAETMALAISLDHVQSEAASGKRADFERYLNSAPNTSAAAGDTEVSSESMMEEISVFCRR